MQEAQETWVWSLGWDDLLEGKATHSSILARIIPWTEEPGGLQSIGSQRDLTEWLSTTLKEEVGGSLLVGLSLRVPLRPWGPQALLPTFILWTNLFLIFMFAFFFVFFWLLWVLVAVHMIFTCSIWDLVPWPGIEPGPSALGTWGLSHWPTREVPCGLILSRSLREVRCGRNALQGERYNSAVILKKKEAREQ